ncbi:hypothetical protein MLD38_033159 [Melastoma candidum]|uniref:Uncharacterized protein n=1 Tax=Melastoma candidum TaxID=119954 RepID=A0ACB9M5L7_9MYRT|nr:hypothetical protein MLD38_033159 [Melastoma candidum]
MSSPECVWTFQCPSLHVFMKCHSLDIFVGLCLDLYTHGLLNFLILGSSFYSLIEASPLLVRLLIPTSSRSPNSVVPMSVESPRSDQTQVDARCFQFADASRSRNGGSRRGSQRCS